MHCYTYKNVDQVSEYVQNSKHNVFLFTVCNVKIVQHPNPDNKDSAVHPTRNFFNKTSLF